MSRMISFLVLVGIIIAIGILFYRVMVSFLLPLFLAALLVVMFRPLHRYYLRRVKGRPAIAAGLTTATVMLIVLVPIGFILTTAAVEASSLLGKLNDRGIREKLTSMRERLGLQMPFADDLHYFESSFESLRQEASAGASSHLDHEVLSNLSTSLTEFAEKLTDGPHSGLEQQVIDIGKEVAVAQESRPGSMAYQTHIFQASRQFRSLKTSLLGGEYQARLKELANPTAEELDQIRARMFAGAEDWFRSVGGATGAFAAKLIFGIIIMVIGLHFFLLDGPTMISSVMRLSPLDDRHEQELLDEFDRVSRAVVVATLLSAVVQGVLAGLGFWVAGLGSVILLTVLTTVFALIPFVGAAAVWVPASLYLFFFEERQIAAVILAIYGAGIVSMADNVIKPFVLHGQSNLHPLLALLSVLGGVQALGPIGVLVGPMVVVFLQTLLNILHRELMSLENDPLADT